MAMIVLELLQGMECSLNVQKNQAESEFNGLDFFIDRIQMLVFVHFEWSFWRYLFLESFLVFRQYGVLFLITMFLIK